MSESMPELPAGLARRMTGFGERGHVRLAALPALLDQIADRWALTIGPPFPNLTYNYVAPATRPDGVPIVLKIGMLSEELIREAAALRFFDGQDAVRLLEFDAELGVLLLERLEPGTALTSLANELDDERATSIAASVMRRLWKPASRGGLFSSVGDWGQGFQRLRGRFGGGCGPLPTQWMDRAEKIFAELSASSGAPVLLHGDLHHDNILSANRLPWVAIDPKGLIGEPAYECGALLRNLWPDRHSISDPKRLTARRVDRLSEELAIDRERIAGWAIAQSVLSATWSVEDGELEEEWAGSIAMAEMFAGL